jgi:hypothetical protein
MVLADKDNGQHKITYTTLIDPHSIDHTAFAAGLTDPVSADLEPVVLGPRGQVSGAADQAPLRRSIRPYRLRRLNSCELRW